MPSLIPTLNPVIVGSKNNFECVRTMGLYEKDNGVRFQKIGNTFYGDNGTECRNVGFLTYCD